MTVTPMGQVETQRIDDVAGVMFDIDGCLVLSEKPGGEGGTALSGAADAISLLRESSIPFVVFTNGSSRTPAHISSELALAGIEVPADRILTPSVVAARVVRERHPGGRVLAFGGPGVVDPLRDAGADVADVDEAMREGPRGIDAVVIGWDTEFGRVKIQAATEALRDGAALYCTSDAPAFASRGRVNVGVSGFIAVGLQHVSGTPYELVGKPSPDAMAQVAGVLGVAQTRILVVGDDLTMECAMANAAGAMSALVTTGMSTRADAEAAVAGAPAMAPTWVIDSMFDFAELVAPVVSGAVGSSAVVAGETASCEVGSAHRGSGETESPRGR